MRSTSASSRPDGGSVEGADDRLAPVRRLPADEDAPGSIHGLVASYPRSGLNWVRYCIELASGRPTPGRPLLHDHGSPIIARSHDLTGVGPDPTVHAIRLFDADGSSPHRRLVLLLRNYKECLASEGRGDLGRMVSYAGNLVAYDRFDGPKLLVHYEDLVADFAWMERILDRFAIPHRFTDLDMAYHQARSRLIYHARRTAYTRHDPLDGTFHSLRLSPAARAEADRWIEDRVGPDRYRRHLARYHETALAYPP